MLSVLHKGDDLEETHLHLVASLDGLGVHHPTSEGGTMRCLEETSEREGGIGGGPSIVSSENFRSGCRVGSDVLLNSVTHVGDPSRVHPCWVLGSRKGVGGEGKIAMCRHEGGGTVASRRVCDRIAAAMRRHGGQA